MHKFHYQTLWRGLSFAMLTVILVASLLPVEHLPEGNDKIHHFVSYAVLALGWFLFYNARYPKHRARIAVVLIVFGGVIELLQGWSGYRYAEWADVFANSLGVFIVTVLLPQKAHNLFNSFDQNLYQRFS